MKRRKLPLVHIVRNILKLAPDSGSTNVPEWYPKNEPRWPKKRLPAHHQASTPRPYVRGKNQFVAPAPASTRSASKSAVPSPMALVSVSRQRAKRIMSASEDTMFPAADAML